MKYFAIVSLVFATPSFVIAAPIPETTDGCGGRECIINREPEPAVVPDACGGRECIINREPEPAVVPDACGGRECIIN
ncbi:hypothetical protein C8F04DRAFT_1396964 [Mycena alexandri]|uniref:Uncharacterized protein n=1 Tax=Mycena alexandri TaxID=1745969 RepID=A0AAD6SR05_9AGAR|nr:hypothetical protein C8F04DRAFT_1396964 [Mycena alexandri]